jgi:hypothetical protein
MRCWAQHLRPDSTVWPYHAYSVWPLSGAPKIPLYCMEYNWPTTLTPTNEESPWAQWGKKLYRKLNDISIESSEVDVWLVWILTTKCKSLKRVETCQKKHFNFWLFCHVNRSFRIKFQTVFTLWICISFWFVPHQTLDCSFAFEWRCSDLGSERIPRLCLADWTCTAYSSCFLKVCNHTYWPALSGDGYDHQ